MRIIKGTFLTALLCVSATTAVADTIYKWVDERGTVHYGERPPEGVQAELVTVKAMPPQSADDPYAGARRSANADEPSAAEQNREERAERIEAERQEAERLTAACAAQRSRLEQLVPRTNILVQNPDGTSYRLDDNERLSMIEESQTFVDDNCADY
ncbi:MAG: DUF4124 domain-containing protein [Pseudomonadota bacterium]